MRKTVAVNERGIRIGEDHQRAKLTNHEVDLLLELREDGWSYRRLADKFEISKSQVRYICKGHSRCQTAVSFKTVHILDDADSGIAP
jgi:ribosome-binding protein aMBF1 (putative translation factor)